MIVVFAGPTIAAGAAQALLPCIVLSPARQGDVWRAVQAHRPRAIGLIDGVFLHEPAVWHRELLWAMAQGVHVWGAASMGALRAAELAAFGMRGVGRVFQSYLDGRWPGFDEPFEDDDEVAVTHAPAALGALPLSDAMVDVRDTLLAAEAAGVLDRAARDALAAAMKALPFPDRSFGRLAEVAAAHMDFTAWLPTRRVHRKRLDAEAMLRAMADDLAGHPPPFAAPFAFRHPQVWEDFLATTPPAPDAAEQSVLDELRRDPAAWRQAGVAALGRLHALSAVPPGDAKPATSEFRIARGLARRADVDAWLADNAMSHAALGALMADEAALVAALDPPPPGFAQALLAHLRLSGQFARLLARARTGTDGR